MRVKGVSWSWCQGARAFPISLMRPEFCCGLSVGKRHRGLPLREQTDSNRGHVSLKLIIHTTLLPLTSRIQEEASGYPLHHTVAEEDSRKLNAGHFFLVGSPQQSPPRAKLSSFPLETSRHRSSHVLPLPLSPQRNSSGNEDALPCSLSLLNGLPTSYPSSWDTKPCSSGVPDLCCRPSF